MNAALTYSPHAGERQSFWSSVSAGESRWMKAVAIWRRAGELVPFGATCVERSTHDDAAAKILCELEDDGGDVRAHPCDSAGDDGEHGAEHGGGHDDEDGRDAEAGVGVCAGAGGARVDVAGGEVVVASHGG